MYIDREKYMELQLNLHSLVDTPATEIIPVLRFLVFDFNLDEGLVNGQNCTKCDYSN